jgi:uncharacterized protein (DUF1778 family)
MPAERKRRVDRAVVPVSLPRAAKRLIERAATKRYLTLSEFLRAAAVGEAERVLAAPGEFTPTPAPVAPTAGAGAAAARTAAVA